MRKLIYLDASGFLKKTVNLFSMNKSYWDDPESNKNRWDYYRRVVELVKAIGVNDPSKILELGTMGISVVENSVTMDYEFAWKLPYTPTIIHDAMSLPWPFAEKQFEVFIALRVFHHLSPMQKECLREGFRIARHVILVIPPNYSHSDFKSSKGLLYKDFVDFLDGVHPNIYMPTRGGDLYYWDSIHPSRLNIEDVFKKAETLEFEQMGHVDKVEVNGQEVIITGWAIDASGRIPDSLLIKISGQEITVPIIAAINRPDVNNHLGLNGGDFGFIIKLELKNADIIDLDHFKIAFQSGVYLAGHKKLQRCRP